MDKNNDECSTQGGLTALLSKLDDKGKLAIFSLMPTALDFLHAITAEQEFTFTQSTMQDIKHLWSLFGGIDGFAETVSSALGSSDAVLDEDIIDNA